LCHSPPNPFTLKVLDAVQNLPIATEGELTGKEILIFSRIYHNLSPTPPRQSFFFFFYFQEYAVEDVSIHIEEGMHTTPISLQHITYTSPRTHRRDRRVCSCQDLDELEENID
jgi:hypothetical protein